MDTRAISSEDLPDSCSPAEVAAAEKVVNIFMANLKNFGLFPPNHPTTTNTLISAHKAIVGFITQFDDLCFEIDKTKIIYGDHTIYNGPANDENPAYIMYRDGLRWLGFEQEISKTELKHLFQTFHHFREMVDEPDDDLVSALWRLDLHHIFYQASDELWEDEPALDFSALNLSAKEAEVAKNRQEENEKPASPNDRRRDLRQEENKEQPASLSVAFFDPEQDIYHLSPTEINRLEQDIKECIEQGNRKDIIGLMLLILNQEHEIETFEVLMNSLKEELRISLESKEFQSSSYLLANIKKIHTKHNGTREWSRPLWEKFYGDIVKPEILSTLTPVWQELPTLDPDSVKNFTNFLRLLPTKAGVTFAADLNQISALNARSLMVEIIASFAIRDLEVLELLMLLPEEDLGLRLMRVVNNIDNEQVAVRLLKKIVTHQISTVRTEAQKSLYRRGGFE